MLRVHFLIEIVTLYLPREIERPAVVRNRREVLASMQIHIADVRQDNR